MQDIYIPETKYVPNEYIVAAILLLPFMVLISLVPVLNLLYFYIIIIIIKQFCIIIIIIKQFYKNYLYFVLCFSLFRNAFLS